MHPIASLRGALAAGLCILLAARCSGGPDSPPQQFDPAAQRLWERNRPGREAHAARWASALQGEGEQPADARSSDAGPADGSAPPPDAGCAGIDELRDEVSQLRHQIESSGLGGAGAPVLAGAGSVDGGIPDASPLDAAAQDAGTLDAGMHAGSPDSGAPDAGASDAGSSADQALTELRELRREVVELATSPRRPPRQGGPDAGVSGAESIRSAARQFCSQLGYRQPPPGVGGAGPPRPRRSPRSSRRPRLRLRSPRS